MLTPKDASELDKRLLDLIQDFGLLAMLNGLSDVCGMKAIQAASFRNVKSSTAWNLAKNRIYEVYIQQRHEPGY